METSHNFPIEECEQKSVRLILYYAIEVKRKEKKPNIVYTEFEENKYYNVYFEMIDVPAWVVVRHWVEDTWDEDTSEMVQEARCEYDGILPKSLVETYIHTPETFDIALLEQCLGHKALSCYKASYSFKLAPKFWKDKKQLETTLRILESLPREILDLVNISISIETHTDIGGIPSRFSVSQKMMERLLKLNASIDFSVKKTPCLMSEEPYIYEENLQKYAVNGRVFRRDEDYKEDCLKLVGFELYPEDDPEIRIDDENGHILVVFNFMPPCSFQLRRGEYEDLEMKMKRHIGVDVIWEDREFFLIQYYKKDTISRIIDFVENFRAREGYYISHPFSFLDYIQG